MNQNETHQKTFQPHDHQYENLIRQLVSNYQAMVDQISTKLDTLEQQYWQDHLAS